ncbi:pilin [Cupriavidus basilensis]|uniref:pilin n=1 Tax=Cupriavidus basilensis TaxID=68895 RepID=UPI0023E80840|nr:prepilin-type N-terminal cleavage/methylation domain-containing protein [Cupriavidus basilensis]MDF3883446.1 prepilin-type N-terminal cleavage/methylation domain-containing protein [Cupriavidus basilensis]
MKKARMGIKRVQKGFTLIELMIVVAIIGILAAIAIPQYADYQQRTKVSGAAAAITAYKTGVAMCIQDQGAPANCNGGVGDIPADIVAASGGATISYVDTIGTAAGVITVTTTATTAAGAQMTLIYTPNVQNGVVQWGLTGTGCSTTAAPNTRGINCNRA